MHGPVPQGEFLRRLGIGQRAERLKANATPQQAADIDAALARLTADDQMGELFKVLAIAHPTLARFPDLTPKAQPVIPASQKRVYARLRRAMARAGMTYA